MRELFRVVNLGMAGEPVVHGLQNADTLQVIRYEDIKFVNQNGEVRDAIVPNDPDSFIGNENQSGYASVDESGIATLYFD